MILRNLHFLCFFQKCTIRFFKYLPHVMVIKSGRGGRLLNHDWLKERSNSKAMLTRATWIYRLCPLCHLLLELKHPYESVFQSVAPKEALMKLFFICGKRSLESGSHNSIFTSNRQLLFWASFYNQLIRSSVVLSYLLGHCVKLIKTVQFTTFCDDMITNIKIIFWLLIDTFAIYCAFNLLEK